MKRMESTGPLPSFLHQHSIPIPGWMATLYMAICLLWYTDTTQAQGRVKISSPVLKFTNDMLFIRYDIEGHKPGDHFQVRCEITDSAGDRIYARSIYGDIGDEITGGPHKQIIWDLAADSVFMDESLNVEIFATRKVKPQPIVAERKTEDPPKPVKKSDAVNKTTESIPVKTTDSASMGKAKEKPPEVKKDTGGVKKRAEKSVETKVDSLTIAEKSEIQPGPKTKATISGDIAHKEFIPESDSMVAEAKKPGTEETGKRHAEKSVKTGSVLLLSAVCPGWGLTRLSGGKPWWLLGIAGYGCIATSYYFNRQASYNYDKYIHTTDIGQTDKMDEYFNTGKDQYTASNILALSAVALWIADFGYTWIKSSRMRRPVIQTNHGSLSLGSSYDPYTGAPLISLHYSF